MDVRADPASLVPLVRGRYENTLATLEQLVNTDSGSWSRQGVNRVADLCEARFRATGWAVERLVHRPPPGEFRLGDVVIGRRTGAVPRRHGGRRLLVMAHMDTVFDDGTAAARPFRVQDGLAFGPGVTDDKAGIVAGFDAVEVLCDEAGFDGFAEITMVCSPDEEIGSPFSRAVLTRLAGEHDAGIGLEAARVDGSLVTARKGISAFAIDVVGKAVHAGVRPERGVNAALEAARKAVALHELNGRWQGVTCNVGVIRAGTRPNVVAEHAHLEIDLRAVTNAAFDRAAGAVAEIAATSFVPGTTTTLRAVHRHLPMERTEAVGALLAEAQQVAAALGFEVGEQATGGAGDANTTSAAGLPTIDGFAPIGGDAHGPREWLDLGSVVPRTALLAGFLARLGRRDEAAAQRFCP
jgi:glutamate carboxypeptidase